MTPVAELTYFTGPMDCGKSTLALQVAYTESEAGRKGRLFTMLDRSGEPAITSRIGLTAPATEVTADLDFWRYVVAELTAGQRIDFAQPGQGAADSMIPVLETAHHRIGLRRPARHDVGPQHGQGGGGQARAVLG